MGINTTKLRPQEALEQRIKDIERYLREGKADPLSATAAVTSVFGRTGAVTAASNDYTHAQLSGLTTGDPHTQYPAIAGRGSGQTLLLGVATSHPTGKSLTISDTGSPTHTSTGEGIAVVTTPTAGLYLKETSGGVESKFENTTAALALGTVSTHPVDIWYNGAAVIRVTSLTLSGPARHIADARDPSSATAGGIFWAGHDDSAAIESGHRLGRFAYLGTHDTSHNQFEGASISGYATELWTSTAHGTKIVMATAPNASTTQADRLTVEQDGSVRIHNLGDGMVRASSTGVLTSLDAPVVPYKFEATMAGAQTTTSGAFTKINYDTEVYDTGGNHDAVTTKGTFTAPVARQYDFRVGVAWNTSAGITRVIGSVFKNGSEAKRIADQTISPSGTAGQVSGSVRIPLAAGDTVDVRVFGVGAGAVIDTTAATTYFQGNIAAQS